MIISTDEPLAIGEVIRAEGCLSEIIDGKFRTLLDEPTFLVLRKATFEEFKKYNEEERGVFGIELHRSCVLFYEISID